jgi:hypothetical protein
MTTSPPSVSRLSRKGEKLFTFFLPRRLIALWDSTASFRVVLISDGKHGDYGYLGYAAVQCGG